MEAPAGLRPPSHLSRCREPPLPPPPHCPHFFRIYLNKNTPIQGLLQNTRSERRESSYASHGDSGGADACAGEGLGRVLPVRDAVDARDGTVRRGGLLQNALPEGQAIYADLDLSMSGNVVPDCCCVPLDERALRRYNKRITAAAAVRRSRLCWAVA